ncbi:UNVERIFIED_ORG: hypothetical protein ABRZ91_003551 [Heyndrickxia coagulans]
MMPGTPAAEQGGYKAGPLPVAKTAACCCIRPLQEKIVFFSNS